MNEPSSPSPSPPHSSNEKLLQLIQILMNYCSVLYSDSLSLLCIVQNIHELCSILNKFKVPLKYLLRYYKSHQNNALMSSEINTILHTIFQILQVIQLKIIEKARNQTSDRLEFIVQESLLLYRQLEDKINYLVLLLKRVGIYNPVNTIQTNSPWIYPHASSEVPVNDLWPMVFLPDRNLTHHPRADLSRKICELIRPSSKPQHLCFASHNNDGGMGKSEMILECTYRSLEDGVFGAVFWLCCRSEASLVSSLRLLASRIQQNDPSFLQLPESDCETQCISNISKSVLIELVIKWIERLELPYLIVYHEVVDISFIKSNLFPQCGQGTIILLTYSLYVTKIKNILKNRPKLLEFSPLTTQEGLLMCEDSFDSIDMIPKSDMLDLINFFELSPAHVASAITVINCMRNHSFLEIGPREYLNKLANTCQVYPKGHSTGNRSSSPLLRKVVFTYQSLQMQLHVAKDLNFSSHDTIDKLLEFLCYISPHGIDLRLLFDWIRPSHIPIYIDSKIKESILWKPTPIKMTASLLQPQVCNQLLPVSDDLEISITINSLLPRLVKTTGELAFLWNISRTISDIGQFCEFLSHLWRKEISFPFVNEGTYKSTKVIADINELLKTIFSDPLWLQNIDHISCKKFLGIHIADDCDIQVHDKMMFVISPLVATGVLKIQHHIRYSNHSQASTGNHTNTNEKPDSAPGMLLGIHPSFQSAITHQLQIASRGDLVSQDVVRFLYGYFLAPTEESWADNSVNKDNLLPHVISVVLKTSTDFKICLELCNAAYDYSYRRGLYSSAFTLGQRILDLILTLHQDQKHDIAQWKYKVAYCCYRSENYSEANKLYVEALELFQRLSSDVTRDTMIAKLFGEMSDINLSLNNFDTAALHLISMSEIWFTLSSSSETQQQLPHDEQSCQPQHPSSKNKVQREIIEFYKKMTTIKMLSKNYHQAIESSQHGLDLMVSVLGHDTQEVASFMVCHGEAHMKLHHFHESKIIFEEAMQIYQKLNPDLVHANVPPLLYMLSICSSACDDSMKLVTEKYLHLCLDVIQKLLEKKESTSTPHKFLEIRAECLRDLSYLLVDSDQSDSGEAILYSQQAYDIVRQLYGVNSHDTALALCHIGKIYKKLIKYSEAKKIFHQVLIISEKCLRNDAAIEALNNLADIYFSQSKYIETEQYLNKALARLREIQYEDGDVESTEQSNSLIAQQLCTLADLKRETNEFEKSRQYYEGALLILKTTYGAQHNSVAQVLEMLSDLFMERGEERIGKRYRDEALKIYESIQNENGSPEEHSTEEINETSSPKKEILPGNSTSALGGLAALLSVEGRYDDIIPLQEKAFQLLSNQYGNNFPRIALALNNLGRVLRNKGRYSESQAMQEKALDILRKVHGENHPHVATALYNLGISLCLQEKYSDAIIQIKASLDRRKVVFNDSNPIIYDTMRILSYLYYLEGSFSQSRTSLEECLKIKKRNQFTMSEKCEITILLNNLGLVLKGLLMYTDSEEMLRESLALRLDLYSNEQQHVSIATAYYTIGRLLLSMKRFSEAKDYLTKSQKIREAAYTKVHPFVANTYHSLSEVEQSLGNFNEAINLMIDVIDIRTQLYGEGHLLLIGSLYRLQTLYKLTSNELELRKLDETLERNSSSLEIKPSEDDYSTAVLMLLDGFEDTIDGGILLSNTSQFIKMDMLNKSKSSGIHDDSAPNGEGNGVDPMPEVITGGPGWIDRLLISLTKKSEIILKELKEKEFHYNEKKSIVEFHENEISSLKSLFNQKLIKEKELENLIQVDKRFQYDLQKISEEKQELSRKLVQMGYPPHDNPSNMGNVRDGADTPSKYLVEIKEEEVKYKELVELIEQKFLTLSSEIQSIEILNYQFKEMISMMESIETKLHHKRQAIEKIKYDLIHQEEQQQPSGEGEGIGRGKKEKDEIEEFHAINSSASPYLTSEEELKLKLSSSMNERHLIENEYEILQIQYYKLVNKLNVIRQKYNIPSDGLGARTEGGMLKTASSTMPSITKGTTELPPSSVPSSAPSSNPSASGTENAKKRGDSFLLDDCDDVSDPECESDVDGEIDAGSENDKSSKKLKTLSKRVHKQRLLIDLLTNQVVSLGAAPIAEVVTLVSAEQRLQQSLIKLMEGDEEAAKDFDKWDQFVRNHPEFKQKEELKKVKWKNENTPINAVAYRCIKSMTPPNIMVSCTLAMLESQLPKQLAKRIWSKKALWLTRISSVKIGRLHIADLQSKYSPQGLDEIELRAIYHALPATFENDGKGEKASWKNSILDSLQSKSRNPLPWAEKIDIQPDYVPSEDEIVTFLLTLPRNPAYKSCSTLDGPYDPNTEFLETEEVSHKDETELSPQELISKSFESMREKTDDPGDSSTNCADDAPTRSIMRRASIFGLSKTPSGEKKSRTTNPNAGKSNSMSNLFGELKEKSDRKGGGSRGGGGMASMMEEMKQKSLKRNASLNQQS